MSLSDLEMLNVDGVDAPEGKRGRDGVSDGIHIRNGSGELVVYLNWYQSLDEIISVCACVFVNFFVSQYADGITPYLDESPLIQRHIVILEPGRVRVDSCNSFLFICHY